MWQKKKRCWGVIFTKNSALNEPLLRKKSKRYFLMSKTKFFDTNLISRRIETSREMFIRTRILRRKQQLFSTNWKKLLTFWRSRKIEQNWICIWTTGANSKKGRFYILASATCLRKTGSRTGFQTQNLDRLLDRISWETSFRQKAKQG